MVRTSKNKARIETNRTQHEQVTKKMHHTETRADESTNIETEKTKILQKHWGRHNEQRNR